MDANAGADLADFEGELQELRSNEPLGSMQFVAQVLLLLVCSVAGSVLLGLWQLPIWFVLYYSLLAMQKVFVARLPTHMPKKLFVLLLALLMFNASAFNVMPIFLWFQDEEILKFGTMAIVTGSTLNSFLTRTRYPSILACYLIPNASVFLIISFGYYHEHGWSGEFIATAIVAVAISTYFTVGLLDANEREIRASKTHDQLQQAQRMEVIGRLTGGVSHDFNNLLSVVSGSLQLLRDTKDEEERSRLIEQAIVASKHGSDLTKQMLAFGRQSPLVPKSVDTAEVLRDLDLFLRRLLPASINLRVEVDPATSWVRVDSSMIQSALINLALNSNAAMPNGGDLVIRACNVLNGSKERGPLYQNQKFVQFSVEDTGEGIPHPDLDRVFEPFFTTHEVGKGSGMGLPMVKGFIEQSGGHVDLTSVPGIGTKVLINLPASKPKRTEASSQRPTKPSHRPSACILVVDDNTQLLELVRLKLVREGYEVWACESGDEAASLVEQDKKPDLLVTDVVMTGKIQGPELARLVKSFFPDVPVIMMSGYVEARDKVTDSLDDADQFLEKPLELNELSDIIAKLLSKFGSRQNPRTSAPNQTSS